MRKTVLHLFNAYLPPLLWCGVIFVLSAQSALPSFSVSFYDFIFKKSSHMFVYGVLYFLLHRGVNLGKNQPHNWILPFFLCFLYALGDELHQMFTPNRHPSPRDVGFDMLGAFVAFLRIYRFI